MTMLYMTTWLSLMLTMSGLMKLTMNWNHLITMLLALEFMVLSTYFALNSTFLFSSESSFYSLYFLTIAICESALGMSMLILMSRNTSSEMMLTHTQMKW